MDLKDIINGTCKKAISDKDGNGIPETYLKKTGDAKDNTVTFQTDDNVETTMQSDPANPGGTLVGYKTETGDNKWHIMHPLDIKDRLSATFNKFTTLFHNVRYLYELCGKNDISKLGDGTLTGAISKLNTDLVVAKAWKTSAVSFMACTGETSGITVESFLDRVVSEAAASNTAHGDSFQSIVGAVEGPIFCALTVIHSTKKYYGGFAFTYSSRYQAAQFFCEGGLYGIRFP